MRRGRNYVIDGDRRVREWKRNNGRKKRRTGRDR